MKSARATVSNVYRSSGGMSLIAVDDVARFKDGDVVYLSKVDPAAPVPSPAPNTDEDVEWDRKRKGVLERSVFACSVLLLFAFAVLGFFAETAATAWFCKVLEIGAPGSGLAYCVVFLAYAAAVFGLGIAVFADGAQP